MNEARFFQWIVGERRGEVLIFDKIEEDDNMIFISFKDGSRINEDFVGSLDDLNPKNLDGKMMVEVENATNIWKFRDEMVGRIEEKWAENGEGEKVCVQPAVEGRKKVHLIAPKPSTSKFGQIINKPSQIIQPESIKPVELSKPIEIIKNNDPVYIMLEKAKKTDLDINMSLTISLPAKSLFNVIKESFENGNDKAIDYIIDNIDIDNIKEEIKKGINILYNEEEIASSILTE